MTLSAHSVSAGVLVLDVEAAVARLPAETRAQLVWTKPPIARGLKKLREEALTDELVAEVGNIVAGPLMAIGRAVRGVLSMSIDEYRAAIMQDLQRDQDLLGKFVNDEDSRETLATVVGLFRSLFELTHLHASTALLEVLSDELIASISQTAEMQPIFRAMVALMAAVEEAKSGSNAGRARELLDVAFLEMLQVRDFFRRNGLSLMAFPFETTDQRRELARHYAERLQSALTEADWAVLDDARLRDLR